MTVPVNTIKLRVSASISDHRERVDRTCGVEEIGGNVVQGGAYREGAICPLAAWQPLSNVELSQLAATGDSPHGVTIDITRAPDALVRELEQGGLRPGWTEHEYVACVKSASYQSALARALLTVAPFVEIPDGFQILGTSVQPGNLISTTTHADPGKPSLLSGLHVDNWDRLPLGGRGTGRRQMCINLGSDDRYFVFAGVDVDTITNMLGRSFDRAESYIGIGRAYFARFPQAEILRVRIRPREMYIAPTDNLVHDGSTSGSQAPDVTLNLRGFFDSRYADLQRMA